MEKYRKIREIPIEKVKDQSVLLTGYAFEKMDGGNVQIEIKYDGLSKTMEYGTRKAKPEPHSRAPWFETFKRFVRENYEQLSALDPATYYLEFLAPHTVEYKDEFVNKPFLIDVMIDGKYINYEDAMKMANKSGDIIVDMPVLHKGEITGYMVKNIVLGDDSPFSKSGEKEGVVLKNYDTGHYLKVLNPEVVKKRKEFK